HGRSGRKGEKVEGEQEDTKQDGGQPEKPDLAHPTSWRHQGS
ncbi:MAG: hypothetical protein RL564_1645, partial [Pseudomonadota bacterium]